MYTLEISPYRNDGKFDMITSEEWSWDGMPEFGELADTLKFYEDRYDAWPGWEWATVLVLDEQGEELACGNFDREGDGDWLEYCEEIGMWR